ncbi:MAG: hypothetical protein HQL37_10680 [Alphaproteobacteria bacterium]|nr:hypothetical protein [Alphaproteobacteria bacterium]
MNSQSANESDAVTIVYTFRFKGDEFTQVRLSFHRITFELLQSRTAKPPAWAVLDYYKCGHCPLVAATSPLCPFAEAVAAFIPQFEKFYSYDEATVEVATERRTIVYHGPLQNGMAALIGLAGATCGCPHLAFLRPMARFHLPFASEGETMYRAVSMDLLRQYLLHDAQRDQWPSLDGLRRCYAAAAKVNMGMAARIRAGSVRDAAINGLIILDTFAQAAPYVIEGKLEELRHIFENGNPLD